MRLANIGGRANVVVDGGVIDVAHATDGAFGPDLISCFARIDELVAAMAGITGPVAPLDQALKLFDQCQVIGETSIVGHVDEQVDIAVVSFLSPQHRAEEAKVGSPVSCRNGGDGVALAVQIVA